MVRVLASDGMDAAAVKTLEDAGYEVVQEFYEPDELAQQVKNYDVLVVRSATKVREPIIDAAAETGKLRLIIRGGVGVDNIDVAYAESKGIKVRNTPAASSASVAEMAIGQMFAISRFIGAANVSMRQGKWEKKKYKGVELAGKTLGIIGIGRIGQEVAKRAAALGMTVIYTDVMGENASLPYTFVSQDEIFARADYITMHIPAAKDAAPIINAENIAKMKDGVRIINTARGVLVDEDALCDALESGKVAGAALDVYKEEPCKNERLLSQPNVSLTPHVGASTKEAQKRIGEETVSIIREMCG